MVSLAAPKVQKKLKEKSPDLFDREPNKIEIEQGRAALMQQYKAINVSAPGGVDLRRNLRRGYPGLLANKGVLRLFQCRTSFSP